jgi:hypothetical protein
MKAVVYSYSGSSFADSIESVAVRTGYLLADMCINPGRNSVNIAIIRNPQIMSRNQKLVLLYGYHKEGEEKDLLDSLKTIFNAEKTVKFKTKQQLGIVTK